jgi:ABC-type polysaccharide/polyol phosphate transport system ATPase subunit
MSEAVIHAEGLGKRYRVGRRERYVALRDVIARVFTAPLQSRSSDYLWALHDICFDVRQGEVIGLIGRNGSGKTTLLKLLSRITRPTAGFAEIRGRVGSLLEVGTGFHPELTGRENIYLSGAVLGMKKAEINNKFDEIVAFSEVERFLDTTLKHFSTGMQMRLAFAVAAHLEPEILLVDEVLAVGDLDFQKKCLGKMQEVSNSGRTIVFVSHQMNQMRRLCDRVLWINDGQICQSGPTNEVISAYEAATVRTISGQDTGSGVFSHWSVRGQNSVLRGGLEEVTLHFHLGLSKPIRQGHFGTAIVDSENVIVIGWGFDNLDLSSGTHELVLRMPILPLQPGTYTVTCALFDGGNNLTGGELVEQWHAVPPLIVDTKPLSHSQDAWAGILNVPANLEVAQAVAIGGNSTVTNRMQC